MRSTWAVSVVLVALVCVIAAGAAMVQGATASSSASASAAPAAPLSRVAGTVSASVVVNRFRAIGRKVVGLGTATSTYTDANGVKSVKRKHFWMSIRSHRTVQQSSTVCQILFLEIGEVDLTLAGLHAFLRAANPDEPIRLRLQADDAGGILGRLFCQLASAQATLATKKQARLAARLMTRRVHRTTILRAKATIYAPNQSSGTGLASSPRNLLVDECPVLHLVLGPVHLELLGLIADLNKVVLDLTAVPGTLLGNIFCQLVTPPPSPARASAG
jgi:hypothetical protein